MDYGMKKGDNDGFKMGSSTNSNSSKVATLQERKKVIEETLAKHNKELRTLCIQEAELTGVMPVEFPLNPGETPPVFRRRVGTSFQLPQNLINSLNNEEEITALELEMQVLAKLAEAALGLANENNGNKTVRRTHMADYQQHKQRYNALEEKLHYLKTRLPMQQEAVKSMPNINLLPKQRKKPRPSEQETTTNSDFMDPFGKPVFRHSLRSLQHPTITQDNVEYRYTLHGHQKLAYRNSDTTSLSENTQQYMQEDEPLSPSLCKLNLNGYQDYPERQEGPENLSSRQFIHSQSSNFLYKHPQYMNPSHTLPHASRHSPQLASQTLSNHYQQDFHKYNNNTLSSNSLYRQPSPVTSSGSGMKYYPYQGQTSYKPYKPNHSPHDVNPLQIQPHQQYEQLEMGEGLGGYWKRSLLGEMIWCNTSNETVMQLKDKRFGSLDRRKNKRIQKRLSPNVDIKSATLAAMPSSHEQTRIPIVKHQPVVSRQQRDSRQLVRTQSLGSVGVQTVGSVSPSEESCSGSETSSYTERNNTIRKHKQKEWYETLLDGPTNSMPISRSHSTIPSIAPEDKYTDFSSPVSPPYTSPQVVTSPTQHPSKILEIPAESNPSPRLPETTLEIFNNNVPRNGTVVQQALWKPYHEETKPFEMSDFYKYSTKFKKSPQKSTNTEPLHNRPHSVGFRNLPSPPSTVQSNLNENFEDDNASVIQKGIYQPLQPMKCQAFSPVNKGSTKVASQNTSLDLSATNIAENFSAEMNAWYQNHEHQTENNNATLV